VRLDIAALVQSKKAMKLSQRTRVKVVKNKVAPRLNKLNLKFIRRRHSFAGELVDLGVAYGFIQKAGSWYSYGSDKIGRARTMLKPS